MNSKAIQNRHESVLLPHQLDLIEQFFTPDTAQGLLVRWAVGLGRLHTASHIIARQLTLKPDARVLVLGPAALQLQTQFVLHRIGIDSLIVDRFRFREMQEAAETVKAPFGAGRAFLMSAEFAIRDDIRASLGTVQWTLIVVDEVHRIGGGKREALVRDLVEGSPDVRLLALTIPGIERIPHFGIQRWSETELRRQEVTDSTGRQIFGAHVSVLRQLEYRLSEQEQLLRSKILDSVRFVQSENGSPHVLTHTFERAFRSSPSAVEAALRRLRNRLSHFDAGALQLDEGAELLELATVSTKGTTAALERLGACIEMLDSVEQDSKRRAFEKLLAQELDSVSIPLAMCIFTEFQATLHYLQAVLDELGIESCAFHGAMSEREQLQAIHQFRERGGVLIATNVIWSSGAELGAVDSLVLYDVPRSEMTQRQLLGRFNRLGRNQTLTVHALVDATSDPSTSREAIDTLARILREDAP
ncbi:helicase-related protein [Paraburkholderia sediminicola]|uniref:helicase-related protein n=1 Tax=Paraburkholderia sediminicola TaxID=458836 RepID=UPI0038BD7961